MFLNQNLFGKIAPTIIYGHPGESEKCLAVKFLNNGNIKVCKIKFLLIAKHALKYLYIS